MHPPPFNWSFDSGSEGIAQPSGEGLHVIFFGRADLILARQLLLLPPGQYRLAARVADQVGDENNIIWSATCLPAKQQILNLPIVHRDASIAADFRVPGSGCEAQWLELKGLGREMSKSTEVRIREIRIAKGEH